MAKSSYSTRYEFLAKALIHHALGFEECEENFAASMKYVMSNLLYHHFLDVNSHNVQRSLQGLTFKLAIHGHQKKSEMLQLAVDQFISSPNIENQQGDEWKWSILCFLIELGQHPARDSLSTSSNANVGVYDDFVVENVANRETLEMDWMQEFMGKSSLHIQDKDETLSEWSDDEDIKRSFSHGIDSNQHTFRKSFPQAHPKNAKCVIEEREKRNFIIKESHLATSWISNIIQRPYWNTDANHTLVMNTLDNTSCLPLSEYSVARECLWLLLHPSTGFIFTMQQNNNQFKIRPGIALSHLAQETLHDLLNGFSLAASKLLAIDSWLKETQLSILRKRRSREGFGEEHWGCLESYSDGLRVWRHSFNVRVICLEKEVSCQEGCQTLLWLFNELEPHFCSLDVIYNVHSKAFNCPRDSVLKKTFKLLSLLVQGIETGIGTNGKRDQAQCLLLLFKFALKNHLSLLHRLVWQPLSASYSVSHLREFGIVIKKEYDKSEKALKTFSVSDEGAEEEEEDYLNLPGLNFFKVLRRPLMEICKLKDVAKNFEFKPDQGEDEPHYLEDLIQEGIWNKFCAKILCDSILKVDSTRLNTSRHPNRMGNTESNVPIFNREYEDSNEYCTVKKRVVDATIGKGDASKGGSETGKNGFNNEKGDEKFQREYDNAPPRDVIGTRCSKEVSRAIIIIEEETGIATTENASTMLQLFTEDALLTKAFEKRGRVELSHKTNMLEYEKMDCWKGCEALLSNTLLPVVRERYAQLGKMLLQSLLKDHGLKCQMTIFKSIILLESSIMMNEFYAYIFNKIDSKELLEEYDLTQNLQYCLSSSSHSELANHFGIALAAKSASKQPLTLSKSTSMHIFSSISVDFRDLWPLSIVVNDSMVSKYNKIFVFCLMLKRTTFTLEKLHFKEIASFDVCLPSNGVEFCVSSSTKRRNSEEEENQQQKTYDRGEMAGLRQRIHRLQLLRQWLLYLARVLHDHFTTAVFIPLSNRVDQLLDRVEHFTHFLKEHEYLVNEAYHQCLPIEENLSPIQTTLLQVFATVEKVRELWKGPSNRLFEKELNRLEEQYSACHRLMANFLSTLAATRFCPSVDELAQCLSLNCPSLFLD